MTTTTVALTGTPKQVAWAATIREDALRNRAFIEERLASASPRTRALVRAVLGAVRWDSPESRYWIDWGRWFQFLPYDLEQAERDPVVALPALLKRVTYYWSDRKWQAAHGITPERGREVALAANEAE